MRTEFILVALLAVGLLSIKPAFTEELMPGSNWGPAEWGSDCGKTMRQESENRLKNWFLIYQTHILANSTPEEKDLNHKSVSCSFTPTAEGEIKDLKIEQSSGSEEIDKKVLAIVRKVDLKRIAPLTSFLPFKRGILIRFSDEPFLSIGLNAEELNTKSDLSRRSLRP